jgi:hypothetical protein
MVLMIMILTADVPVFFCTAVSVIILWAHNTIVLRIVRALTSKSKETATDIAAYTFTKYPVTNGRAASPGNPNALNIGANRFENHGSILKYFRNIIAKETPTVILRSQIQVFVVLGKTLFTHLIIFSLWLSPFAGEMIFSAIRSYFAANLNHNSKTMV